MKRMYMFTEREILIITAALQVANVHNSPAVDDVLVNVQTQNDAYDLDEAITDYTGDPNCAPEMWIESAGVNSRVKAMFLAAPLVHEIFKFRKNYFVI